MRGILRNALSQEKFESELTDKLVNMISVDLGVLIYQNTVHLIRSIAKHDF